MNEKELKTSPKQRIFITLIAIVMLGSIIASYAAIILNGGKSSTSDGQISEAKINEYKEQYETKLAEFQEYSKSDFTKFSKYRSEIKAYNETSANDGGVVTKDLVKGDGRKLEDGDTNYYAYYVGWCADETVFDSSFDSSSDPTAFNGVLDASLGLIEGWSTGVAGMRLNGIREITVPGNVAYGESMEICGGYNKPLKFLVLAKEKTSELTSIATALEDALMRYQYALYGIDYDAQ